jgi:transglutaminase-like putative cysteine protease
MTNYLKETDIIDFSDPDIRALALSLSKGCTSDLETAKKCFVYVRDKIRHTGDYQDAITTLKASEVLKHKTGWCYAKSHLLAALLRANGIPAGFSYQRLSCSEYKKDIYCLHGLNAVYPKDFGWYRVDARGNKEGVQAEFEPPIEILAFDLEKGEMNVEGVFEEPLASVVKALDTSRTYEEMINNFPDL